MGAATKTVEVKTDAKIIETSEFQKAVDYCQRNSRGTFSYQCLSFSLMGIEKSFGPRGVALLIIEVPDIEKVIKVPDYVQSEINLINGKAQ